MSVGAFDDLSKYGAYEIISNMTNNTSDEFTNIMSWRQGSISLVLLGQNYNVGKMCFNGLVHAYL